MQNLQIKVKLFSSNVVCRGGVLGADPSSSIYDQRAVTPCHSTALSHGLNLHKWRLYPGLCYNVLESELKVWAKGALNLLGLWVSNRFFPWAQISVPMNVQSHHLNCYCLHWSRQNQRAQHRHSMGITRNKRLNGNNKMILPPSHANHSVIII